MPKIFKLSSRYLALFMFLQITPIISAITVFAQPVSIESIHDVSILLQHFMRVIDASRN